MDRTNQVRQKIGLKVSSGRGGLELLQQPWMTRRSSSDSSRTIKGGSNTAGGSWGKQHTQAAEDSALDKREGSKDVEVVSNEVETCAPVEILLAYILQVRYYLTIRVLAYVYSLYSKTSEHLLLLHMMMIWLRSLK